MRILGNVVAREMEETRRTLGRLFLIPSPLGDEGPQGCLTLRGIEIVRRIRHFAVENARTARRYLSALGMPVAIAELAVEVLDKRVDETMAQPLLQPLLEGYDVGVISEAGAPGIADPGAVLVRLAHTRGVEVVPLVGSSSILLTLMASGMNGQHFSFEGYLPVQPSARRGCIKDLEGRSRRENRAIAFIETPYRNDQMLRDLLATLSAESRLCLGHGVLTATGWVRTQRVGEWRKAVPILGKVPTLFVVEA